jgi:hypothetical protein
MARVLRRSTFDCGNWVVGLIWRPMDLCVFAYRWVFRARKFGAVIWSPLPKPQYDASRDVMRVEMRMGPLVIWRKA